MDDDTGANDPIVEINSGAVKANNGPDYPPIDYYMFSDKQDEDEDDPKVEAFEWMEWCWSNTSTEDHRIKPIKPQDNKYWGKLMRFNRFHCKLIFRLCDCKEIGEQIRMVVWWDNMDLESISNTSEEFTSINFPTNQMYIPNSGIYQYHVPAHVRFRDVNSYQRFTTLYDKTITLNRTGLALQYPSYAIGAIPPTPKVYVNDVLHFETINVKLPEYCVAQPRIRPWNQLPYGRLGFAIIAREGGLAWYNINTRVHWELIN